jgi:hypothetical protein
MGTTCNHREFLQGATGWGVAAAVVPLTERADVASAGDVPKVPKHRLTVVSGKPRGRGRQYGKHFKEGIGLWLQDIVESRKNDSLDRLLGFSEACGREVKSFAPAIMDELEGIAEGAERRLPEVLILACHEELWQDGTLSPVEHCHSVAVGPPCTTGDAYVGQTYDFFGPTVSHLVHWKRSEGPNILAYGYHGLWISVGLNSAGLAIGATLVRNPGNSVRGPRVGIPYYVWATHILSQDILKAALDESRRIKHAGWWTAVLADARSNLANSEVRLDEIAIESGRRHIARHQFGSRKMTATPEEKEVKLAGKAPMIVARLTKAKGEVDDNFLKELMARAGGSHDLMVFNASQGMVHIHRTQNHADLRWQRFCLKAG